MEHLHVAIIPGICGRACDLAPFVKRVGAASIIEIDYDDSAEKGVDVVATKALSQLHSHIDLLSPKSQRSYAIVAHSAGGCIAHRVLDALLSRDDAIGLVPAALRGQRLAEPSVVVTLEPSMLKTDVCPWAEDWAARDAPMQETWLKNVLDSSQWTWPMMRGLADGLVKRCPEPSPQIGTVRACIEKSIKYIYACGEKSSERNEAARSAIGKFVGVTFLEIPRAGHNIYRDNPETLVVLLKESLLQNGTKKGSNIHKTIMKRPAGKSLFKRPAHSARKAS